MVDARSIALLTEGLGVNHLRLVMGTSMGGMHTWLWGERYPDFMDALMPLASLPAQISGPQPRVAARGHRRDPQRSGVEERGLHRSSRRACARPRRCCGWSAAIPIIRQRRSPTLAQADKEIDDYVANYIRTGDANDTLYALESSRDYDPGPAWNRSRRRCWRSIPPTTWSIRRSSASSSARSRACPHGRAIVIPLSDQTVGHGTHTVAAVWQQYLAELLRSTETR